MDIHALISQEDSLKRFGLLVERDPEGNLCANVTHIPHHSLTGFECGYCGSGPADLALAVMHALIPPISDEEEQKMLELTGDAFDAAIASPAYSVSRVGPDDVRVSDLAYCLHQPFKEAFIAHLPKEGGHIPIEYIQNWIADATKVLARANSK